MATGAHPLFPSTMRIVADAAPPPDDLVARACAGDPVSMGALLTRLREPLLQRIRWMMGPRARRHAESMDFLQQVFAVALQHLDPAEAIDDAVLLRWLTKTARHRVHRLVSARHEQALESLSLMLGGIGADAVGATDVTPSTELRQREHGELLVEALAELKPEHRAVIEMRDFEGLSFRQIGEALGKSEPAVQMLHTRALVKLANRVRRRSGPS